MSSTKPPSQDDRVDHPRRTSPPLAFGAEVLLRGYRLWLVTKARFSPTERQRLFGLTILIGGVCGLVAVAFHEAITWLEGVTIEKAFAAGDAWIPWVIAIASVGALAAGVALRYVPGARGSGIPQVKVAYAGSVHRLRLRDSVAKFAIGTVQIGTGSSLGREGPTIQICAGVAKSLGRVFGISVQNLKLLLPVGAAAGVAAAFNAPIAAVTFAIEEIVGKLDQTLLSGVIVAAALAAVVERSILGENPVFAIPPGYGLDHASSLVLYAALGVAAALVSVMFTESLLWLRARFAASRLPIWARPAIGGLVTGCLAVAVMIAVGVGGITGGGYEGLAGALSGRFALEVLLVLGAAKLVATVVSYSSGGAGGIFAPALFIGAMLGGVFGTLDAYALGHAHAEVGSFALVGMGAVFAGVVRAPITSVLIIIEMTGGYGLALPLMISNMMAYGLARRLRPTPIYDALLAQDGIRLELKQPMPNHAEHSSLDQVELDAPKIVFAPGARVTEMLDQVQRADRQEVFPVVDADQRVVGLLTLGDLAALAEDLDDGGLIRAADLMRPPAGVQRHDVVARALEVMLQLDIREVPVVDGDRRLVGMVGELAIAHVYIRAQALARNDVSTSAVLRVIETK